MSSPIENEPSRRDERQRERELARQRAQEREAAREQQQAREELAEQHDLDRRDVTIDDGFVRLRDEPHRQVAAAEFDDQIGIADIGAEDVVIEDGEARLSEEVEADIEDAHRRRQRRRQRRARREAQQELREDAAAQFDELDPDDVEIREEDGQYIAVADEDAVADLDRGQVVRDAPEARLARGSPSEISIQETRQPTEERDAHPLEVTRDVYAASAVGEAADEFDVAPQDVEVEADTVRLTDEAQQRRIRERVAEAEGIHPTDVEVSETTLPADTERQVTPTAGRVEVTAPTAEIRDPALRDIVREELEEEYPDEDIDVWVDDGEVQVEIDDTEERETWIGRRLEDASDAWVDYVAEPSGAFTERVVPEVDYGAAVLGADFETGYTMDETAGGFVEGVGRVTDPAGATLFAGDVWAGTAQRRAPVTGPGGTPTGMMMPDPQEATDPEEVWAQAEEAALGAQEAFADDPARTAGLAAGGVTGAIFGPTVAVRGGRRVGQRISRAAPDDTRIMTGTGPDRGQMDMTIQRQRERPRDQPADPAATTPEGRAPPREAFPSEEAYQAALRRHEERIVREAVDESPAQVTPDATPVERVRSMRDEFASHAEYQRELQRAREQMHAQQRAGVGVGERGAQTAMTGDMMQPGDDWLETEAFADADSIFETDEVMAAMDAEPTVEETVDVTADVERDVWQDIGVMTDVDAMMDVDTQLTADVTTTTTATPTRTAQPTTTVTTTRQPQITTMMTGRPPRSPRRLMLPAFEEPEEEFVADDDWGWDDALWETGIADAEDVFDGDDWGWDDDDGGW